MDVKKQMKVSKAVPTCSATMAIDTCQYSAHTIFLSSVRSGDKSTSQKYKMGKKPVRTPWTTLMRNHFSGVDEHLANDVIQFISAPKGKVVSNHDLKVHFKDKYKDIPNIVNKLTEAGMFDLQEHYTNGTLSWTIGKSVSLIKGIK